MATIKKPDANPIVALLLTFFVFQLGHLLINGQQRKWLFCFITTFVIGIPTCGLGALVVGIMSCIDAMQTAERLQKGEEIGDNEYTLPILHKIISIVDKTSTCKNAGA